MFPTLRLAPLALVFGAAACAGAGGSPAMTAVAPQTPAPADCPALGTLAPPPVPAALQPPAGATLAVRYRAQGAQIYTCKAAGAGFAWSLKGPDATLLDEGCKPAGTHFAGPTWKSDADQSAVVAKKVAEAPSPAGAVPWLLLASTSTTGQGVMTAVVAVQRVDTSGGVPPPDQCGAATAGSELRVPYTATYYFYKK